MSSKHEMDWSKRWLIQIVVFTFLTKNAAINIAVLFILHKLKPVCCVLCHLSCNTPPQLSLPDSYGQWVMIRILLLLYLLTPWCRVLLEKLTGLQLVKNFPAFHGTRRFITAHTNVRQLSLSWASPIQSIYPLPSSWVSILILSIHLRLGLRSGLFPCSFPIKILYTPIEKLLTYLLHGAESFLRS